MIQGGIRIMTNHINKQYFYMEHGYDDSKLEALILYVIFNMSSYGRDVTISLLNAIIVSAHVMYKYKHKEHLTNREQILCTDYWYSIPGMAYVLDMNLKGDISSI